MRALGPNEILLFELDNYNSLDYPLHREVTEAVTRAGLLPDDDQVQEGLAHAFRVLRPELGEVLLDHWEGREGKEIATVAEEDRQRVLNWAIAWVKR